MHVILIIDDDADLRVALGEALREEGYQVHLAWDAASAVRALDGPTPPCVAFVDLVMPGTDGWELIAGLQADPRHAQVPVVVFSATVPREVPPGVRVARLLGKPFSLGELLGAVTDACAGGCVRRGTAGG